MAHDATEVALIKETRGCKECKWFWGPVPPYGPFPTFDFDTPYPQGVRIPPPAPAQQRAPKRWLVASSRGTGQISPAVLHGCRKAPIMTVGINPNMGGFYATPEAARYAYPQFSDEARYAYYYRHRHVTQERIERNLTSADLLPASAQPPVARLLATENGTTLEVARNDSHRWVQITYRRGDGSKGFLEFTWDAAQVPVVLAKKDAAFQANDTLAGVLAPLTGPLTLQEIPVGYYERFEPVLRALERMLDCPSPTLRIGEDVSQGDMIACASPGWERESFDIPRDTISRKCGGEQRFILRQLLQSQPAVLVFVGRTALSMFADHAPALPWLSTWKQRESYDLLRETTTRATYIDVEGENVSLHARVLCTPHFSYSDNYVAGLRLTEVAWQQLEREHPDAARLLAEQRKVVKSERPIFIPVDPRSTELPLSARARLALLPHFFAPVQMLARALFDEIQRGNLSFDGQRLGRAPGHCSFCVNSQWSFPEGCPYPEKKPPQADSGQKAELASTQETRRLAQLLGKVTPTGSASIAVRVWRGRRRHDITPEKFLDELQRVFVPATVRMMRPLGLVAYVPTLVHADPVSDLPEELALVFYKSQRAYEDARKTPAGKAYGAMHGAVFQFPESRSAFAVPWHGGEGAETVENQPFLLLGLDAPGDSPLPAPDWQALRVEVLIARETDRSALTVSLRALRANPPPGLKGYIFVHDGKYYTRWAAFDHQATSAKLVEQGIEPALSSTGRSYALPLEPAEPESPVPLHPGCTLNMVFACT